MVSRENGSGLAQCSKASLGSLSSSLAMSLRIRHSSKWRWHIRAAACSARLDISDALGDEVRSASFLAGKCPADSDGLYRLPRAVASIGVTEGTTPERFLWCGSACRRLVLAHRLRAHWWACPRCPRSEDPFSMVAGSRCCSIFRAVMGREDYAPTAEAWDFPTRRVVCSKHARGSVMASLGCEVLKRNLRNAVSC